MPVYDFDAENEGRSPENQDAERAILGAILLDNLAYDETIGKLSAADFILDSHRRIFARMSAFRETDTACDIVTLSDDLRERREIEAVGGVAYLASLTEGLPRQIAIDEYVHIVREKSQRRRVISLCNETAARSAEGEDVTELCGRLSDAATEIVTAGAAFDNPHVSAYSTAAFDSFSERAKTLTGSGFAFGLNILDEFTGKAQSGEVTIVGARSGVGKTSLYHQIISTNCILGIPVNFYSLEESREECLMHLWSIVSEVPYIRIKRAHLSTPTERQKVMQAKMEVDEWPLRIFDAPEQHIGSIVASARSEIRKLGVRIVLCDYAQIVSAEGRDDKTRVSNVSKRFRAIFKGTPAHGVLSSQLRKMPSDQYNNTPTINDLRETGQLENDATNVLLLHRGWDAEENRISSDAEIIIPKARNGETGLLPAQFNRRTVIFEDREAAQ